MPASLVYNNSRRVSSTWNMASSSGKLSQIKSPRSCSTQVDSVEADCAITKRPARETIRKWLFEAPSEFRLSFKAPLRIAPLSRLADYEQLGVEGPAATRPVAATAKLGLVLFQLPPNFKRTLPCLEIFLALPQRKGKILAFELRHPGWFTPETYTLLTAHNAVLCIAATSFCLRYTGGYKPRKPTACTRRCAALTSLRNNSLYFKHTDKPACALNSLTFQKAAARVKPR